MSKVRWSNEPAVLSAIVAGVVAASADALALIDAGGTILAAAALWLG